MRSPFREDPRAGHDRCELTVILPVRNEAETLPQLLADLPPRTFGPPKSSWSTTHPKTAPGRGGIHAMALSLPRARQPRTGKEGRIVCRNQSLPDGMGDSSGCDTQVGPDALAAVADSIAQHGDRWDMALLPLRLASDARHAPRRRLDRLQALDFAAMQGWAVTAADRGRAAMASGGGWVWRTSAFPHDQLRPDLPSGDDVFALAALIERGDQRRVGRIDHRAAMVSVAPMPTLRTLLHQRIRWGAKSTHYPPALREARRVALVVAAVHARGWRCWSSTRWQVSSFWSIKSTVDMVYTARVGRAYGLLPSGRIQAAIDLLTLACAHPPVHCHHPPLDALSEKPGGRAGPPPNLPAC